VTASADVQTSDPRASWNRNKTVLTLHIGPEPVSVRNLPYLPIPLETFPELMAEAETLVGLLRLAANVPGANATNAAVGVDAARRGNTAGGAGDARAGGGTPAALPSPGPAAPGLAGYTSAMYQTQLTDIRKRYKEDAPLPSIAAITGVLEDLRYRLRPYVWSEAEPVGNPAPVHSFDEALERRARARTAC
jgi:hypothetical protein